MWSFIVLAAGIAGFVYLLERIITLVATIQEQKEIIERCDSFRNSLIGVAGDDPKKVLHNIETYLYLLHRHRSEDIFRLVFPKDQSDLVDWKALDERHKSESGALYTKLVQESQMKVPMKGFPLVKGAPKEAVEKAFGKEQLINE